MKDKPNHQELPRRPGRQPVDRRDEILDAAQRLYADLGFERTTIGDVAGALGMSPANLYRSFPNRRAIDEAVAARRLRLIEDMAWTAARTASSGAAEALRALALTIQRTTRDALFHENRISQLCLVASRESWPVVERYLYSLHGAVRHVLVEGQRSGEFNSFDVEVTAGTVVSAMTRVWHPHMLDMLPTEMLDTETERLCDLVLNGLACK